MLNIISIHAAGATTDAPWWGVPVIAGSFLLLGAVLGFFFNRANDRSRAKREADLRWHDIVRTLSAALLAHAERINALVETNNGYVADGMDDSIPVKVRVVTALENEQRAMRNTANELIIIVPKSFVFAIGDFLGEVFVGVLAKPSERDNSYQGQFYKRNALLAEVRKYLGLPQEA